MVRLAIVPVPEILMVAPAGRQAGTVQTDGARVGDDLAGIDKVTTDFEQTLHIQNAAGFHLQLGGFQYAAAAEAVAAADVHGLAGQVQGATPQIHAGTCGNDQLR